MKSKCSAGYIDEVDVALYLTNFNITRQHAPGYHVRNRFVIKMQRWIVGQRDILVRDTMSVISRRKAIDRLAIPLSGQRPRNLQAVQGRDRTRRRVVSLSIVVRLWIHVDSDGNGWDVRRWGSLLDIGNRFGEIAIAPRLCNEWWPVENLFAQYQENSSVIHIVQLKHLVNAIVVMSNVYVWNPPKCIDNKRWHRQTSTSHFNDSIFPQQ